MMSASTSMSWVSRCASPVCSSETVIEWASSVTVPSAAVSAPPSPPASPTAVTSSPTETPLASVDAVARPDASSSWSTATSRFAL